MSLRERANEAFKSKDYEKAIELYTEALKEGKEEEYVILSNRAAAFLAKDRKDEAERDARHAIEIEKSYLKGYYRLCKTLEAKGKINESIDVALNGIATDKGLFGTDQNNRKQFATLKKLVRKLTEKLKYVQIKEYLFSDDRVDPREVAMKKGKNDGLNTKVYIKLDGVGKIPRRNIQCKFERKALDLKIRDLNGANYRLREPELWGEIYPDKCKFIVKKSKIIVKLRKADMETQWEKLGYG